MWQLPVLNVLNVVSFHCSKLVIVDVLESNLLMRLQMLIHWTCGVDGVVEVLMIDDSVPNHHRMLNSIVYVHLAHPISIFPKSAQEILVSVISKFNNFILVLLTKSFVCVPTLCRCTAFELNHSAGGNCAENVSICRCFERPLRRNNRDNRDVFSVKK